MCGLDAAVLDRRLDPDLTQPIAVAFSGGGDSLAALIMTKVWADRCGRPVVALHVDHGLQPQSRAWATFAAETAGRVGADFRGLTWRGQKPTRGLAAAARRARHGMIAAAARAAGATTVVFGHTADDIAEADLMRAEGSTLGPLHEWRPSPVWPEGRGVFVLRPLLNVRRAAIRQTLRANGWSWIDDPANEDQRHPRARARRSLGDMIDVTPAPATLDAAALGRTATIDEWGAIRLDRDGLLASAAARRVLAAAMLSAGGGERPPRGDRVGALLARLAGPERFSATLAGAKLIAADDILIVRDAGEAARGGLADVALEPGAPSVWDGRFALRTDRSSLTVRALKGLQAQLDPGDRGRLSAVPAAARPALPVTADGGGRLVCPILARDADVETRVLVGPRFLAACGVVSTEPRA